MNFLSRKSVPKEPAVKDEMQQIVHREIEITVQRTWTSVSATAQRMPNPASESPSPPGEEPV